MKEAPMEDVIYNLRICNFYIFKTHIHTLLKTEHI